MSYNERVLQIIFIACLSGMVESHDDQWGIRWSLRETQKFWDVVEEIILL
jgi:hypothetical protein